MPALSLDAKALEAYLPHRGVNLLPDVVELNEGRTRAVSRTRVRPGDPRGRQVMGRTAADGTPCWYEPFLGELMALTGVPLLHERLAPAHQVAVFSMISRITFERLAPLDAEVVGEAEITRDRGAFTVFATRATVNGQKILEAEVMSGCATLADIAKGEAGSGGPAPAGTAVDPAAFAWKPAATRFIDAVVSADAASGKLVAAYRYPTDHPFVPGHFPGGALMMGVTQWGAVADAAWAAARLFGHRGVLAQGTIARANGAEILDVRDLELVDDGGGVPRIAATKRIAFRDKVLPGDEVLVSVSVVPR
jgi:3-hydroxymyristoyl/3-hydroxydecanoyl-(acyl carrier protein) dehydratase